MWLNAFEVLGRYQPEGSVIWIRVLLADVAGLRDTVGFFGRKEADVRSDPAA